MKYQSNLFKALMLAICFAMISCGNSVVNNGGSANDVGYDPTKMSNLRTMHYDALQQRLLVTFGLTSGSDAYQFLTQNRTTFENSAGIYNSTYATNFIRLMSLACEEVENDEVLFPSGDAKIDEPWKKITGFKADESAKELEASLLSKTSSMGDDYKKYALCLGAATSARATFTNYASK